MNKSFIEHLVLQEGLIQVPASYVSSISAVVYANFFSYVETMIGHEAEKHAEILKRIQFFRRSYRIPGVQIQHGDKDFIWDADIDYAKIRYTPPPKAVFPPLIVAVRWESSDRMGDSDASYDFRRNLININTNIFADFVASPSVGFLTKILMQIRSDVEHELSHMIQYLYFERPSQGKATRDKGYLHYKKRNDMRIAANQKEFDRRYYTSPVEYSPQIKTAVDDFEHVINITTRPLDEIKDAIRSFTGFKSDSRINIHEFFSTLLDDAKSREDYKKYNNATKEFYKEVMKRHEEYTS